MAVSSIAFLNMIESRMAKPFMCLLISEAIEAIVKVKRKNDCNFFKDCAMAMWIAMALFVNWEVDSWNHICIFNLSTLELDNTLQILSFAGFLIVNSAKEWVQALYKVWNWVQNGCNFEILEKEESRKSLIYRTLSWALQDGLEPTTPWLTVRCSNQLSYWSSHCC